MTTIIAMTMFFVNRKKNLKYLKQEFDVDRFKSISITGRSRTGEEIDKRFIDLKTIKKLKHMK